VRNGFLYLPKPRPHLASKILLLGSPKKIYLAPIKYPTMKKNLLLFCLFILIAFGAEAQLTLNGVTLPAKVNKDNTELILNGGGIRKKLFFKLYTFSPKPTTQTT
jgi:hypothetical protein